MSPFLIFFSYISSPTFRKWRTIADSPCRTPCYPHTCYTVRLQRCQIPKCILENSGLWCSSCAVFPSYHLFPNEQCRATGQKCFLLGWTPQCLSRQTWWCRSHWNHKVEVSQRFSFPALNLSEQRHPFASQTFCEVSCCQLQPPDQRPPWKQFCSSTRHTVFLISLSPDWHLQSFCWTSSHNLSAYIDLRECRSVNVSSISDSENY